MQNLKKFNAEGRAKNNIRLNLFSIAHESCMPFELLFKKNLRKRQTDLFLDSWRKITSKLNLSYQFKCKSKQQFFNLFMDAFQNCIEDIGNTSCENLMLSDLANASTNSTNVSMAPVTAATTSTSNTDCISSSQSTPSSSVQHFRQKMCSSFEQCKLWPIVEEEYAEFLKEAQQKNSASKNGGERVACVEGQGYCEEENLEEVKEEGDEKDEQYETMEEDDEDEKSVDVKMATSGSSSKSVKAEPNDVATLADYISRDLEMQSIIKDMIKSELGEIIKYMTNIMYT